MRSNLSKEEMIAWRNRNIQDTRYIGKWLSDYIIGNFTFNECEKYSKKVIIANKNLVTYLKKRIGRTSKNMISELKYSENALITATVSHDMVNKIIEYSKTNNGTAFPLPWPKFENDIINMPQIFVSRAPKRKTTGPAHDETIRRMQRDSEGAIRTETRTDIKKLKLNVEGEIENYSPKSKKADKQLYKALRQSLIENGGDAKKAFVTNFYRPQKNGKPGNIVNKVKIDGATKVPVKLKNKAVAKRNTNKNRYF